MKSPRSGHASGRWGLAAVAALVLASACDSGKSSPPPGSITGRERLGWGQQAPHADELREYFWALYVDGIPIVLTSATCT